MTTTTPGVLPITNLKSAENWRAFLHQLVAIVVPIIVTANIVSESQAVAWVPFVLAIIDNALSVGNATDRVRRVVYAAAAVLQTGGLATALLTEFAPSYVSIGSGVLAVLTATLARFYTPTTTVVAEPLPPAEFTPLPPQPKPKRPLP